MRTGSRRRSPRSRPASRSCSRSGAPTSSSPAASRGSCGRCSRRARVVIAASQLPRRRGARRSARARCGSIPNGVEIPAEVGEPAEPPHVLFVGPAERGEGDPRVPRGDRGAAARDRRRRAAARPRARRRSASSRTTELGAVLRARRRRLRPVAAGGLRGRRARGDGLRPAGGRDRGSAGLPTRSSDGETGLVVGPEPRLALRAAVERLLGDPALRARLGAAARREGASGSSRLARRPRALARRLPRGDRVEAAPVRARAAGRTAAAAGGTRCAARCAAHVSRSVRRLASARRRSRAQRSSGARRPTSRRASTSRDTRLGALPLPLRRGCARAARAGDRRSARTGSRRAGSPQTRRATTTPGTPTPSRPDRQLDRRADAAPRARRRRLSTRASGGSSRTSRRTSRTTCSETT